MCFAVTIYEFGRPWHDDPDGEIAVRLALRLGTNDSPMVFRLLIKAGPCRHCGSKGIAMIDVMRLAVTKDDLLKMTVEERGLFLLLGYAANQITALLKLITIATNVTPDNPVEQRMTGAQTQIFVRLMVGLLNEALLLVQRRFVSSKLGPEFIPKLDAAALDAPNSLRKRFGTSGQLATIRSNYAFHHPDMDGMEAAFQLAAKGADNEELDWSVFMTASLFNSSFYVADFVIAHGVTNALGETDVNVAHQKFLSELSPIANELTEFAYGFAAAIFKKYFGGELTLTIVAKVPNAPNIDDLRLPFFVDAPGMPRKVEAA